MTITIQTSDLQEAEKLLLLLKSLNISSINIEKTSVTPPPTIAKGDKKINPRALFGIWKSNPRTLEEVRSVTWKRNWNI
jgi:hypothetical protein